MRPFAVSSVAARFTSSSFCYHIFFFFFFFSVSACCVCLFVKGAEYCDERVCLSVCVCVCVREHISGTALPMFTKFLVHVTDGCGSVDLWWCCDTLMCTSGLIDDAVFANNMPGKGDRKYRASTQGDSSAVSVDLRPRRILD